MAYSDRQTVVVDATPDQVWSFVGSLGGDPRVWTPRPLWWLRTAPEALLGATGYRITGPGRPLEPGDQVDFWEVEAVHPGTRLTLRALTALPGTAHLDVRVHPHGARTELSLETTFEPAGLAGHAYWWSSLAAHKAAFAFMARRWAALAVARRS